MWRVYLAVGLFAVCGAGLWHYGHVVRENRTLKTELSTANATVAALDAVAKAQAAIHEKERNQIDEIDNAPDSDDGPIAPVLRRALAGLQ